MYKYMVVEMDDGSKWGVPVEMIAMHRAKHYVTEFGGDIGKSLNDDTIPLFELDAYEIHDWAVNNMNWSDFDGHQVKLHEPPEPNFQRAWLRNTKSFK